MSDMDLEAPDADSAEQEQDAMPTTDEHDEPAEIEEIPLEAPAEDTAEQARAVRLDDDDYR
jgi:hypothetical protein